MNSLTMERPMELNLQKIKFPQNKVIQRLKEQLLSASSRDSTVAYSRMHSRHNRG